MEFESLESMSMRLAGTGGGAQVNAVIEAVNLIKNAPGMLDNNNRSAALYHLAVALSGEHHAAFTVENTYSFLNYED